MAGDLYQLVGTVYAPAPFILTEPLLAIDPQGGWALVWDEWIALGDSLSEQSLVDPADVQRVGAAWLTRQHFGPSVH